MLQVRPVFFLNGFVQCMVAEGIIEIIINLTASLFSGYVSIIWTMSDILDVGSGYLKVDIIPFQNKHH